MWRDPQELQKRNWKTPPLQATSRCQHVPPLHLQKQQQKRQKWKRKSECAAGRMMREADTCPCSSWLRLLSCCPIRKTGKKTKKPRKNTWRNVLNCWDIFNIF
uniref:Uncharacterized protein n=1 Tax=Chlorocebus sabaeus TaxID=60711 RepID=A0A0D9S0I1_CHLSB